MRLKTDTSAKKLRGGFYTPPALAALLARWVTGTRRPGPLRCLEPSCGDGNLVRALAATGHPVVLTAFDIDEGACEAARTDVERLGVLHHGDYLTHANAHPDTRYDAVIGNPPYIRYQFLPPETRTAITERLATAGVKASRHANAWLGFVVDAVDRLEVGGRVALVLPAELLQVQYTADVRRFLLERLRVLDLHTFTRPLFDGVLQEVLVLLGEAGPEPCVVRMLERDTPEGPVPDPPALPVRAREDEKWTRYWLDGGERRAWERLRDQPGVRRFDALATVEVGIVTGANRFFCVDAETVERFGLHPVAVPLVGRSAQVRGLRLTEDDHHALSKAGEPVYLLHFPERPLHELPEPWQVLLREGEDAGLHTRYKCRIREPWYRVPAVWPSPVSLFKRCNAATRLVLNEFGAVTTDTVYRVAARDPARTRDLVSSFCNSLTWVSVELNGRSYGGGVLELVPTEIRRLRLPDVRPPPGLLDELDALWRAGAPPLALLEAADPHLLGPLGIGPDDQALLRALWQRLSGRRLARSSTA